MVKTNLKIFSGGKISTPKTETVVKDLPCAACSTSSIYGGAAIDTSRSFLPYIKRLGFALLDYNQAPWQDPRTTFQNCGSFDANDNDLRCDPFIREFSARLSPSLSSPYYCFPRSPLYYMLIFFVRIKP